MLRPSPRGPAVVVPLSVTSAIVVLVVFGLARGVWLPNLHNGLLAVAFGAVGAYVSVQRPANPLGRLFLLTGGVEAVVFCGRQIGHTSTTTSGQWWGWLGVWPVVVTLALVTLSVLSFPDGRRPSPRWRPVVIAIVSATVVCAVLSAGWPVEYDSAGLTAAHPLATVAPGWITSLWSAIAHPTYAAFQVLWVVAVVVRWRRSSGTERVQLGILGVAAATSAAALVVGLAVWRTPTPGVLSAAIVPVAAGWAVVQGRHLAAYSALSWLSRARTHDDLASALVRAVSEALDAPAATLWVGDDVVHAVGVWPDTGQPIEPTTLATLLAGSGRSAAEVLDGDRTIGVVTVDRRAEPLSRAEQRLFDDLVAQARLVIVHLGLAERTTAATRADRERRIAGLTPREHDVLALMARGLSNAAICQELFLSIKTVEPIVSSIFNKLGLQADSTLNRRVLAVVAYLDD